MDRIAARRFLLAAQGLLDADSKKTLSGKDAEETLQMIRRLECVQIDPVAAAERNQHLVLAARMPAYRPSHLEQLLVKNKIFEYIANEACVIPMEDYAIFEPIRDRYKARLTGRLEQMGEVVEEVLTRLREEGPLPSRAFRSSKRVHGYWDNTTPKTKETSLVLNLLLDMGIVMVARRDGTERFFDLADKTVVEGQRRKAASLDRTSATQALIDKYIRAYRLFDAQDPRFGWCKIPAGERRTEIERRLQAGVVTALQIEGIQRPYYILSEDLEQLRQWQDCSRHDMSSAASLTFLPPLDNLLWRRERIVDLFDFHYKWEIYTPAEKRLYGYYAMPILYGDRLIGRMDPRLDRKEERLVVRLLQLEQDVEITSDLQLALRESLEAFARFHQAKEIVIDQTVPDALRKRLSWA
ncbi:winged helix DNA-binding domain-containing protein [Brevibacillus humidisoli]|uniref:winged helix-turn-helix domain-containing protein n=1 Tax=Brevibacillus humidisoli TaxID=2895522 RepID=UPI001E5A069E|nr:crosslink repair DNA glycosylase YcaQ family protein [Brevibacillus humidisoli]UFJ39375.1 winged helix DNA-binding domain-containing protein [Brevibacillus humidisoli]